MEKGLLKCEFQQQIIKVCLLTKIADIYNILTDDRKRVGWDSTIPK
jgi:hypothetical protein